MSYRVQGKPHNCRERPTRLQSSGCKSRHDNCPIRSCSDTTVLEGNLQSINISISLVKKGKRLKTKGERLMAK